MGGKRLGAVPCLAHLDTNIKRLGRGKLPVLGDWGETDACPLPDPEGNEFDIN